jgi:lipopolysaccharide heptosyltransferase II
MLPERLAPRRIALLKPSALGDIVHSLPVLTALRGRFPLASITWVVNTAYEPLIRNHPDLTDTLPFDRSAFKRGLWHSIRYALSFGAELRRRRFDLVIDLQGLFRTGLMCLATGAGVRLGFANAREGSRYAYTHKVRVPDADRIHAVDRYWRVAEALEAGGIPKRFHVPLDPVEVESVRSELAELPRPWVAVAVGAKWLTKRWPTSNFASLLDRAHSHFGGTAIFVGASDDTNLTREVIQKFSGTARDFTGKTSLPRLAALLAKCDVMLGNDTGPLHLAAALGKPCVAPYLCTRVTLHGPYGSQSGCVETSVACGGSYLKQCDNMICMPELTPEKLWPRFAEVLDAWQRTHLSRSA